MGQRLVLKEMSFVGAPNDEIALSFEREARVLERLTHVGIPRFVDSFTVGRGVDARLFLVQELIEGESFADLLGRTQFSEREIIDLLRQVLDILVYLQSLTPMVFHRDIKPANLLRRRDGSIVLVDFGAARDLGTTSGATVIGTFGYMPIEQHAGIVDATTDLHALGATAWHLASRVEPWKLWADPALQRRVNLSPGLHRFLDRMVTRDARRRFVDARAARDALDAVSNARPRRVWSFAGTARPAWGFAAAICTTLAASLGVSLGVFLYPPTPVPHHRSATPVAETSAPAGPHALELSGFLAEGDEETLYSDHAGTLFAVNAKVGDRVNDGQALALIKRVSRSTLDRNEPIVIRASLDGLVAEWIAEVGAAVGRGQAIVRLRDPALYADVMVPEADLSRVRIGDAVDVTVVALSRKLEGKVAKISAKVERSTGTAEVRIRIVGVAIPTTPLRPGMTVSATFR
jgi:biotin carboxyl carrier protein